MWAKIRDTTKKKESQRLEPNLQKFCCPQQNKTLSPLKAHIVQVRSDVPVQLVVHKHVLLIADRPTPAVSMKARSPRRFLAIGEHRILPLGYKSRNYAYSFVVAMLRWGLWQLG